MRHPTEGVLRQLLDEPAGVAATDSEHVASCAKCARELAVIRDDADLVHAALATETLGDVDVDAAWQRLSTATSSPGRVRAAVGPRAGRLRAAMRRPAVAGVAVALVVTGATTAAANDWLPIFRTERIVPVSISPADLNALPDLRAYGDVVFSGEPDVHPVADAAAAAKESGLDVPEVTTLPRGVTGEPRYQVGAKVSATFTFSAERAARAAAAAGEALPPPPPGMDGTQIRLEAGPGVAMVWSHRAGPPTLIVGRALAPRAFSSSTVSFDDGARLPALAPRPARRRWPTRCEPSTPTAPPCRCPCPPTASPRRRPWSTASPPRCSPPATGCWRAWCGWRRVR